MLLNQTGLSSVVNCELTERNASEAVLRHHSVTEPDSKRNTGTAGYSLWYMCIILVLNLGRKSAPQSNWIKLCGQL